MDSEGLLVFNLKMVRWRQEKLVDSIEKDIYEVELLL